MSELRGKRILVAGGTGDVGVGIVSILLAKGSSVIVPARSQAKADSLPTAFGDGRLSVVHGDVGTVAGAAQVADQINAPLDGVIASVGGWWSGPALTAVAAEEWDAIIAGNLTSHFAVARAFVPLLRDARGTYVQILGAAAEFPAPGSSLVSITAAGVSMMGRALAAEHADGPVSFRQIMIASIVATRARAVVHPSWVTAEDVGRAVADILSDPEAAPAVRRLEPHAIG